MAVELKLHLELLALESRANDLGVSSLPHLLQLVNSYLSGTTDGTFDTVWSDMASAAATPASIDVIGGLTSILTGAAINFVELNCIVVQNRGTSGNLLVGAGSTPVPIFANSSDIIIVPPGGIFIWFAPNAGVAPVAATSDLLKIDPGASTIPYTVLLLGRSA